MKFLSVLLFHFVILVHSAPQGEKKVTWFDEDNEDLERPIDNVVELSGSCLRVFFLQSLEFIKVIDSYFHFLSETNQ